MRNSPDAAARRLSENYPLTWVSRDLATNVVGQRHHATILYCQPVLPKLVLLFLVFLPET